MSLGRREFLAANLALAAPALAREDSWQDVQRVVAVGDVHGDKDAFAAVLMMASVVDSQERWAAGRTHLVQIGDLPARGPQTRQAYDFLMRLEKEADAAGGKVHAIIGNHDAGAMFGDLRNILPAEYQEFREAQSEQRLTKALEAELDSLRRAGRLPASAPELQAFKDSWLERHPPGFVEHRAAFGPSGYYGSWIRRNNAVIRINDTLYLHAGISKKYLLRSRAQLNEAVRRDLARAGEAEPDIASDTQGPLWYRGLSEAEEATLEMHVQQVLRNFGVRRIVVGHAVTRTAILPRFGGRVVNIDIGLSRFYARPPACLVLEGSAASVLHRGVNIPLPGPRPAQILQYLKAVEAADEQPSPVTRLIQELQPKPAIHP